MEPRRRIKAGAALSASLLTLLAIPALRALGDEPAFRWSVVAATQPPATMHPGQKTVLVVLARNDGSATWFGDGAAGLAGEPLVRLAATPDGRVSTFASGDPTWLWSGGTRIRMTTPVVPPGGVGVFAFSFTAPALGSYPADFAETFAPIAEGAGLMEGPQITFTTRVRPISSNVPPLPNEPIPEPPCDVPVGCVPATPTVSPSPPCELPEGCLPEPSGPPYKFSVVATTPAPASMHPGLKTVLAVVVRNEGAETWHADGFRAGDVPPVRLAATPAGRASEFARDDPTWLWSAGTRVRLTTPVVPPGELGAFAFTFTAPVRSSYPVDFSETFQPFAEGVGLMEGPEITFTTRVRPVSSNLPPIPDQPLPTPPLPCDAPVGCLPTPPPPPCEPAEGCLPTPVPTPPCDPGNPLTCIEPIPSEPCLPGVGQATYRDALPPSIALLYAGSGVPFTSGDLNAPSGVAVDGLSKIVVADTGNDRAMRMDAAGNVLFSWGGTGSENGKFSSPAGAAASATAIFIADTGNNRIQVFSLGGTYIRQFGGAGSAPGKLDAPRGISVVPSGPFAGSVAVADTGNNRVQILSPTGEALSVVGTGDLSSPSAVSVYANEIYVADTGHDRIVRYSLGGTQTGVWGGTGGGPGCMRTPMGVVANDYGLFVSDTGNDRLEHFSRAGPLLETWGTTGADANQLDAPAGIVIEATGTLWVADAGNDRLQRFRPAIGAAPPIPCGADPFVCLPPASASSAGADSRDQCIGPKSRLC